MFLQKVDHRAPDPMFPKGIERVAGLCSETFGSFCLILFPRGFQYLPEVGIRVLLNICLQKQERGRGR